MGEGREGKKNRGTLTDPPDHKAGELPVARTARSFASAEGDRHDACDLIY